MEETPTSALGVPEMGGIRISGWAPLQGQAPTLMWGFLLYLLDLFFIFRYILRDFTEDNYVTHLRYLRKTHGYRQHGKPCEEPQAANLEAKSQKGKD
jgi:hypothetical protein